MTQKVARSLLDADAIVVEYRKRGNMDPDGPTCIFDLVTDLLHLAQAEGVQPSEMDSYLTRAADHWRHESDPQNADEDV